jgi:hypothetical protein
MVQEVADNLITANCFGFSFVSSHDAVAQDIGGNALDIFRGHKPTAVYESVSARGGNHKNAGPWRSTKLNERRQFRHAKLSWVARGLHQVEYIMLDFVVDIDVFYRFPAPAESTVD